MMALERQSPAAAHWSRQQYESLFATPSTELRSERLAWIVEGDHKTQPESARDKSSEIHAFLVTQRISGEWELENIVVAEGARRQGLGARLISELADQARAEQGEAIFLEVRESNMGARSLYRKLGFEEVGSRRNYYASPTEDAIIYRLKL